MPMNAAQLWRRVRQADKSAAVIVGMGNLVLCGLLLPMLIGGVLIFEATTQEQETTAQHLAAQVFGYWFAGGLMLFSMLRMTRTLFSHLATMLLPPVALILSVAFSM
ncbi:hypothetical protein ACF06X_27020 [Streptomyces sp. NPDC015346]|uniref:hypothetical protein n=1 Tax=Streptomyces sp. NPDC015346 TaxID=3364954 RepID=UPI0036FE76ED